MQDINPHLIFFGDTTSDIFFPQVKQYVDGKIRKTKILKSEQIIYKREVEIDNFWAFDISKNCDFISGLEITGDSDDIQNHISSIELCIGSLVVSKFYLSECYVMENNGKFSIRIDFDKMFLNYSFLPIIPLQFHSVYFVINGTGMQNLHMKCYVLEGLLENELRRSCMEMKHEILINHYEQYNLDMIGNKIYINFGNHLLSRSNFIKSLKFQFEKLFYFNTITIYANDQKLTTLTRSDLKFINKGFIMENFYYKTFLYNQIILEFDKDIDSDLTLTTTNFNIIQINSGMGGLRYTGLRRDVSCGLIVIDYKEIDEEIYLSKVIPKEDNICCISHQEFEENEERIICGICFASYKREAIEEWFQMKRDRVCPYGRCENGKWYKK